MKLERGNIILVKDTDTVQGTIYTIWRVTNSARIFEGRFRTKAKTREKIWEKFDEHCLTEDVYIPFV